MENRLTGPVEKSMKIKIGKLNFSIPNKRSHSESIHIDGKSATPTLLSSP